MTPADAALVEVLRQSANEIIASLDWPVGAIASQLREASDAITRLSADAARVREFEATLERVAQQAHISGGQWAMETARAALAKDHSR